MAGRLVIGILCFVLGLVLIGAGHGIRHQAKPVEETPVQTKEDVHWLTAKAQLVDQYHVEAGRNRRTGEAYYNDLADWIFVTEDGKTIKVRTSLLPVTKYALRTDVPLIIKYRPDDPSQTLAPLPEGYDSQGNKVGNEAKAADTDAGRGDGKPDTAGLTVIGLCLALLGGAMVYSAFKSD